MNSLRARACPSLLAALVLGAAAIAGSGCAKKSVTDPTPAAPSRSWFMGFSAFPPRPDQNVMLQALFLWAPRADAAIAHDDVPWDSLLAGVPAETLVVRDVLPLVQYFRAQHLTVTYEVELTNGLDRSAEAPALVAAHRSIAEPQVRALARRWAAAIDSIAAPDYIGLGSETNLVRLAAPAPLYASLVQLSHSLADTLEALHARLHRAHDPVLYTSVQVETAWGRLGGLPGYAGIATDLADFPFGGALGLSSYPYLGGFAEPESIPTDYYARLAAVAHRPVMVVEGGWSSVSLTTSTVNVVSSPQKQARYLRTQGRLLEAAHALGWYQLDFTDLDLAYWPPQPPGSILPLFASLGVVDVNLSPKPALAPWDSLFALPRRP
jgi:hypothetical protein